jgi:hypothetical protein
MVNNVLRSCEHLLVEERGKQGLVAPVSDIVQTRMYDYVGIMWPPCKNTRKMSGTCFPYLGQKSKESGNLWEK